MSQRRKTIQRPLGSENLCRSSQPPVHDPYYEVDCSHKSAIRIFLCMIYLLNGEYISRHELVPDAFGVNSQVNAVDASFFCSSCHMWVVQFISGNSRAGCRIACFLREGSVEQWLLLETDLPSCQTCDRPV